KLGQPIYVFFETYGLALASDEPRSYSVEALMVPYEGKDEPGRAAEKAFSRSDREGGVSVSYSATARGPVESQYLILETSGAEPGTYVVGLRLIAAPGRELYTGRPIVIE
ncbi:MAG: hypothetical protein R3178_06405, partial [Rhodothermales bacterium]|nr:hypothetical protein [Rhodothermales bacterium]